VAAAIDRLAALLTDGQAALVVELTEYALARAAGMVGHVDDSGGQLADLADQLQGLHLEACLLARPDPVGLAERLFDAELSGTDLDAFAGAADTYAEVLGTAGLVRYRQLAQAAWELVPVLTPGDRHAWDPHRFRITAVMQMLARLDGDPDAQIEVMARDLSTPYQFLGIAAVCREHGRDAEALAWLEKGLVAFGTKDARLVDELAEAYQEAGRGSDAVALAWQAYEPRPGPGGYRRLHENATRAGLWEEWRGPALAALRAEVEGRWAPAPPRPRGWPPEHPSGTARDGSALVEVFLFEGDVEQAWQEAVTLGCAARWWEELARLREDAHPRDAIAIWQRTVERSIASKSNAGYAQAVEVMARVQRLMAAAGIEAEFASYAASVRKAHRPKRNLMKLLDARGW
jgi:hypothetical protein